MEEQNEQIGSIEYEIKWLHARKNKDLLIINDKWMCTEDANISK